MVWVYYLLLLATDAVGLALTVYTLPGLWVMLGGAAIYAALTHRGYLGTGSLVTLLVLAVGAEIGEFAFGGAGAKKAGGSKWGVVGAIVGAILGGLFLTIPFPIVGTVVGICLGAGAGAAAVELVLGKPVGQSLRIGFGAAKGRLLGIVGKFVVGLVMFLLTIVMAFPVHLRAQGTVVRPTSGPATRVGPTTAVTRPAPRGR